MSALEFKNILKIFGGGETSPEEKKALFDEALLMVLARASNSDTNVHPAEIETVRRIMKEETGKDVSEARVRVASHSELFETTPLEKYLAKASNKLDEADRVRIVKALANVIHSDHNVNSLELEFFKRVTKSLKVDPTGFVETAADK